MAYDPSSYNDRSRLATELNKMLTVAGFAPLLPIKGEVVYGYSCIGGTEILVYSSIVDGAVRGDGEDAIRVTGIYRRRDGQVKPLFKDTRVNRTGEVEKIVERTQQRMRSAYWNIKERFKTGMVCAKCGAPLFLSKNGNQVCAETCWVAPKGV